MMGNTYIEQENLGNHHYRTEIPNIIYKMKLSVYEHAVYSYIKQAAGDRGDCWKSVRTMADEIGISTNKLREVKISLSKPREELGGKPLIRVFKRKNETNNSALSDVIQITDIWEINMRQHLDAIKNKNTPFTGRRGVLHGVKGGTSPREPKEEHTKKNQRRTTTHASASETKESVSDAVVVFFNKYKKAIGSLEWEDVQKLYALFKAEEETIEKPMGWIKAAVAGKWWENAQPKNSYDQNKDYAKKVAKELIKKKIKFTAGYCYIDFDLPGHRYVFDDPRFKAKINAYLRKLNIGMGDAPQK